MKSQNIDKTFHQVLQNKILLISNLAIIVCLILLGVLTFVQNQLLTTTISIIGLVCLVVSVILQFFNQYFIASYITILMLSFAAYGVLMGRTPVTADLLYLFTSYQAIPLILSGILAVSRVVPLSIGALSITLLSVYIFSIQGPTIGYSHLVPITGAYICLIVVTLLGDQIYQLTGNMMTKFHNEVKSSENKDKKIQSIIHVYTDSQYSGHQLEKINMNNDTLSGQLNEIIQKFTEDIHELDQSLKDIHIRNVSTVNSSSSVLRVFNNHKENILEYKTKIDTISEASQEINLIAQNRKVQMSELIELSEKGGSYMQDSISAVEKVAENSKNMVDMISLIMEVAERTNILALNAAVEASRAGKYGGGFAIVAKEIKALSTETTQNAETINRSLQNNILSITETVSVIKNVGQSFTLLNTNIIDFSTAIDQIVIKINDLAKQNSQMAIETKNTLSLINEIQNVLEKTINSIEQGQQKITTIQTLSTTIDKDVAEIHQTTNAISESGRKTQEKYREYNYSIKKVEDIVSEIDQQIKQETYE